MKLRHSIRAATTRRWLTAAACHASSMTIIGAVLAGAPMLPGASRAETVLTTQDYDRAARVLDTNVSLLLENGDVHPRWIDAHRFWYSRTGRGGEEFLLVDARTGRKSRAFDHARLFEAAKQVDGQAVNDKRKLPVADIAPDRAGLSVTLVFEDHWLHCTTAPYVCSHGTERKVTEKLVMSPDQSRGVFQRGGNLLLKDLRTGLERQITDDGLPDFAYGKIPDNGNPKRIAALRHAAPTAPAGLAWSPDGKIIIGTRVDERSIKPYPYLEIVPQDGSRRPKIYNLRSALIGEAGQPRPQSFILDPSRGMNTVISLPEGWEFMKGYGLVDPAISWSQDGRFAYGLATKAAATTMALIEIDLSSGGTRFVVTEHGKTNVWPHAFMGATPNVRILDATGEAVWFSERDGWGHLYLYDVKSGAQKRRLTEGDWVVRDILGIDQKRRTLYFTAGGRLPSIDPYLAQVYRVSLDGGEPVLLTSETADHHVELSRSEINGSAPSGLSPDYRYFVDSYSTLRDPPVTVLRDAETGRTITRLESADASAVHAAGWRPPERFKVRSADGQNDIYGVIYYPDDYDPRHRYPVIDALYGGPQTTSAPVSFTGALMEETPVSRASLAKLGFIVVTIDGRGTPGRSKAFNDATYHSFDPQIEDHVTAIQQLAARYTSFDLDRIGVYGHSFGGEIAARAILSHPEFYKVAVSSAATHDSVGSSAFSAFFMGGIPQYGNHSTIAPDAAATPTNYTGFDNRLLAKNLKGDLLMAYAGLDENVMTYSTVSLIEALKQANKSFDLLYLPNGDHGSFVTDPYFIRRMWDYFVERLLGAKHPRDYDLGLSANAP